MSTDADACQALAKHLRGQIEELATEGRLVVLQNLAVALDEQKDEEVATATQLLRKTTAALGAVERAVRRVEPKGVDPRDERAVSIRIEDWTQINAIQDALWDEWRDQLAAVERAEMVGVEVELPRLAEPTGILLEITFLAILKLPPTPIELLARHVTRIEGIVDHTNIPRVTFRANAAANPPPWLNLVFWYLYPRDQRDRDQGRWSRNGGAVDMMGRPIPFGSGRR